MFHLELRQFPHTLNRFNLDDDGLWPIIEPWVRERAVEVGERKWSPLQADIRILEGPHIPLQGLNMGRGWRTAEREGTDVTEHVLRFARDVLAERDAAAARGGGEPRQGADAGEPDALGLALTLGSLLGEDAAALLAAWREVAARPGRLAPSDALALAEKQLRGDAPASRPDTSER